MPALIPPEQRLRCIYAIVNSVTSMMYIGQAHDHRDRWAGHRTALKHGKHSNKALQRDWALYGAGAFEFRILEVVHRAEDLDDREWHHIDTATCPLYNTRHTRPRRIPPCLR